MQLFGYTSHTATLDHDKCSYNIVRPLFYHSRDTTVRAPMGEEKCPRLIISGQVRQKEGMLTLSRT
eukprot:scaffold26867_cov43-Cyclotella_meneghiniana.AAC.1